MRHLRTTNKRNFIWSDVLTRCPELCIYVRRGDQHIFPLLLFLSSLFCSTFILDSYLDTPITPISPFRSKFQSQSQSPSHLLPNNQLPLIYNLPTQSISQVDSPATLLYTQEYLFMMKPNSTIPNPTKYQISQYHWLTYSPYDLSTYHSLITTYIPSLPSYLLYFPLSLSSPFTSTFTPTTLFSNKSP